MKLHILALVPALGLLLAADAKNEAQEDLKKFQGDWTLEVEFQQQPFMKDANVSFKGDKYVFTFKGNVWGEGTIKLNADAKPRSIDITHAISAEKGKTSPGIYQFDGDTLRICWTPSGAASPNVRPTEFSTKAFPQAILWTLKKPKK